MKIKVPLIVAAGIIGVLALVVAVRIQLLRHSVGVYRDFWNKQNAEAAPEGALTYIALGDSTAQAIGASTPLRGYVGLVAAQYKNDTRHPVRIINLSVSGAKIRDVINVQLPQLLKYPDPSLITIEAGANDIPSFNAGTFTKDFSDLLNTLPDGTRVSNVPSFRGTIKGGLNATVIEANKIVAGLLPQHPNLVPVDLYKETSNQGFNNGAADTFHPNNSGYKNWARAFIHSLPSH